MMCVGDWKDEYEMAGSNMKRRVMVDGEEIGCTWLREGVSAEVKGNSNTFDDRGLQGIFVEAVFFFKIRSVSEIIKMIAKNHTNEDHHYDNKSKTLAWFVAKMFLDLGLCFLN